MAPLPPSPRARSRSRWARIPAGSIRQPASLCGVVGFKPTYGAVSRYGVVAFGSSLDQVGPFGRTVEDVALAMNALTGAATIRTTAPVRIAPSTLPNISTTASRASAWALSLRLWEAEGLTPEVKAAVQRAAQELQNQGAELVEVDLPHLDAAIAAYYVIGPAEAFSNLARFGPHSLRLSGGGLRQPCPTRARFRAPTALVQRPSAVRCSAPTC